MNELTVSTCRRIEMISNMLVHFYNILSNLNNNSGFMTQLKHYKTRPFLMSFNKIFDVAKAT